MIAGQDAGSLGSGVRSRAEFMLLQRRGVQGVIDDVRAEGVNATS